MRRTKQTKKHLSHFRAKVRKTGFRWQVLENCKGKPK